MNNKINISEFIQRFEWKLLIANLINVLEFYDENKCPSIRMLIRLSFEISLSMMEMESFNYPIF
jgi:hypothetical protein